ncbi:LPXTG-motif cell wall-anchored protein [Brevibacterium sanguinis]|uniref:LPXTG-motif cell wall-anchored protein n=2 Tax=Brevibacterium TaxID=1696 RepID=A0A366IKD8_9MICO|nr:MULTISPECIES: LPXTG cell wall anchor domain-containing protein [Brevibacterium]RBP66246.1 LPXTG-motif cell wall-anchored protein [Brevibacterium sanguinis]RBP72897.1 LPXTG-motif cell wall-anchored protein [Brevibacterium celere]
MQKNHAPRSLALTAAAALGLGSALFAAPAVAGPESAAAEPALEAPKLTEQTAELAAKQVDEVNAFGFKDGTLHLGVEKDKDLKSDEIQKLQKKYGAKKVVVTSGVPELDAHAKNDVVGGAGYLMDTPSAGEASACSTGFSGWDGEGKPIVLTAGHCAEEIDPETGEFAGKTKHVDTERPSTSSANGGEGFDPNGIGALGSWGYTKFGSPVEEGETTGNEGDIDFGVIELDEDKYNAKNGVTDWSSADSDDLSTSTTGITSVGSHEEGEVSKSGRTTGLTEGKVIPAEQAPFEFMNVSGRWVHGFAVESSLDDPFSQPGDSGGAVFQGDKAVGVISGGGEAEWEDGTKFQLGWVADLDYSLEESGIDFSLEKDAPQAPAAPVAEDQTIEPKGEVTGEADPGAEVKVEWKPADGSQGSADSETVKADDKGAFALVGPAEAGDWVYTATAVVDGKESKATEFDVTVEAPEESPEAPAERGMTVDPEEIAASDFVKKDKSVTIATEGFDEGEEVTLEVVGGPKNVEGIELKEKANENGVASFAIYGTSESDPEAYVGKYDLEATGANDTAEEKVLTGSFEVVADEDGQGGGEAGGGSDLPRTGAEMTGLAAGAGLLVVGGAAVLLTIRRVKKD